MSVLTSPHLIMIIVTVILWRMLIKDTLIIQLFTLHIIVMFFSVRWGHGGTIKPAFSGVNREDKHVTFVIN